MIRILFFIVLPPSRYGWNCSGVVDSNGIYRTVHLAEVTVLAVLRITDFCFFGFFVKAQHIHRASCDTYPTSDTSIYSFDTHSDSSLFITRLLKQINMTDRGVVKLIFCNVWGFRNKCDHEFRK